jgi:hypothetical protein
VQKPVQYKPISFSGLHPAISEFSVTGFLDATLKKNDAPGFQHAFSWVASTKIGKQLGVHETGSKLFVSTEFGNTVQLGTDTGVADNYPISFVLASTSDKLQTD